MNMAHHSKEPDESGTKESPALGVLPMLNKFIDAVMLRYERSKFVSIAVPITLFMVLPFMALGNAVQGGSPFMLICYLAICLGLFVQVILSDSRSSAWVCAVISSASTIAAMVFLPVYAVRSLTVHILHTSFTDGIIECLLIAILLYMACVGAWTLFRRSPEASSLSIVERFLSYVLFAIPFCYILYWFITFAVQFFVSNGTARDGQSLIISIIIGSTAFALIKLTADQVVEKPQEGSANG